LAQNEPTKSGSAWRSVRKAAIVRSLFLRHWLVLALTGILLGIGAAMLLTPVMSALLYGIGPMDPITYAIMAIVLGAVTLLATYLPAAARHVWHPSSPCGRVSEARACESCSKFERYATGSMAEASSSSSYLFNTSSRTPSSRKQVGGELPIVPAGAPEQPCLQGGRRDNERDDSRRRR